MIARSHASLVARSELGARSANSRIRATRSDVRDATWTSAWAKREAVAMPDRLSTTTEDTPRWYAARTTASAVTSLPSTIS